MKTQIELLKVEKGDLISFKLNSWMDSPTMQGIVDFKDQLGLITVVNGVQYELSRLMDIEIKHKQESLSACNDAVTDMYNSIN